MSQPACTRSFLYDDNAAVAAGRSLSQVPWITELDPCLFLGNLAACTNEQALRLNGITAIVSLTRDACEETLRTAGNVHAVPSDRHLLVSCEDTTSMNMLSLLPDICDFIDGQVGQDIVEVHEGPQPAARRPSGGRGRVLVHCAQGLSRAPTVCIAYLMRARRKGVDSIMAEVKNKRDIRPRENFLHQLRVWEAVQYEPWKDEAGRLPKAEYELFLNRHDEKMKTRRRTSSLVAPPEP
jgi:hypothetical protein